MGTNMQVNFTTKFMKNLKKDMLPNSEKILIH